ncbi:hypothetical protein [Paraburkholderia fungorum]|uniref:hypothetical protein n=1 Tax=Paraburkholderia fungorum TaxID=134537 RepID=UPI0038BA9F83
MLNLENWFVRLQAPIGPTAPIQAKCRRIERGFEYPHWTNSLAQREQINIPLQGLLGRLRAVVVRALGQKKRPRIVISTPSRNIAPDASFLVRKQCLCFISIQKMRASRK